MRMLWSRMLLQRAIKPEDHKELGLERLVVILTSEDSELLQNDSGRDQESNRRSRGCPRLTPTHFFEDSKGKIHGTLKRGNRLDRFR